MSRAAKEQGWIARLMAALGRFAMRPYVVPVRRLFGERPNDRERAEVYGHSRLLPVLRLRRQIILDLKGTQLITQAFFHALLAEAVREDPRRASRVHVVNANERQIAAFELSLRLLLETHAERPQAVTINPTPRALQGLR